MTGHRACALPAWNMCGRDRPFSRLAAYPWRMGLIGGILGAVLAVWLAFVAIGGLAAMVKTFVIVAVIAVAVVLVVSWLARRRRD